MDRVATEEFVQLRQLLMLESKIRGLPIDCGDGVLIVATICVSIPMICMPHPLVDGIATAYIH